MKLRENFFLALMALCLATSPSSFAKRAAPPTSLPTGNALANRETLETLVRSVVARVINADVVGTGIKIRSDSIRNQFTLPATQGTVQAILTALGIKNELAVTLSPIVTDITLPSEQLKVTVKNKGSNRFKVEAKWSLTHFSSHMDQLSIDIPPGLFDQALTIDSKPIDITLRRDSAPIEFALDFVAELTPTGAKIHLGDLQTNLVSAKRPQFNLTLGRLTVGGQPLEMTIMSNGRTLVADEFQIRNEIQALEPQIVDSLRQSIVNFINKEIETASNKIETTPPFQFDLNTDSLIAKTDLSEDLKKLLGGIDIKFIFSYLQNIKSLNLFSAQVSNEICMDGMCILNANPIDSIDAIDVKTVTPDGGSGIMIYESFLKNVIESDPIQKRIRALFERNGGSPGVVIAPSGIKVALVPELNSVAAVVNLEIDIRKTAKSGSRFGKRLSAKFGDIIERLFGAGKEIKIPIEILFHLDGIEVGQNGERTIVITPKLPFREMDNAFVFPLSCATSKCPNNVNDMTGIIKHPFLKTIQSELQDLLPIKIRIPLKKPIEIQGLEYIPQKIVVTPNHGLLITSKIENVPDVRRKGAQ